MAGGGIVACPTETFYALAVDALQERAVQRLMGIKDRSMDKALLVLVGDRDMVEQVAQVITPLAEQLMAQFWPGPLTLILPARPGLPLPLTGGSGTCWSTAIWASSGPTADQLLWQSPHRDQRQPLGAGALSQGGPGPAGVGRCHRSDFRRRPLRRRLALDHPERRSDSSSVGTGGSHWGGGTGKADREDSQITERRER